MKQSALLRGPSGEVTNPGRLHCPPDKPTQQRTFFAHSLLCQAEHAAQNGELIAAGVMLRESLRLHLCDLAARHELIRSCHIQRRPMALAQSLKSVGLLSRDDHHRIVQMIHVGNVAAHCGAIDREQLVRSIDFLGQWVCAKSEEYHESVVS